MAKIKKNEAKCIECEKIYSLIDRNTYSDIFCHVRCRNMHQKKRKNLAALEKRVAKALEKRPIVVQCKSCSISFTTDYKSKKYCTNFCREKYYVEIRNENSTGKKIISSEINQRLEFARVKKNQGPSLKQYNAVRG